MSLVNLEGHAGETINKEIELEGTEEAERSGYWYAYYKETAGDTERADITSWITIEPEKFTIKKGETKSFTVNIAIPKNTETGLWGATSKDAGQEGHSNERRTYIVFKDTLEGGNIYSGLLIPLSVNVLPGTNPFAPLISFVEKNLITIILGVIVVILLTKLLFKRKKKVNR